VLAITNQEDMATFHIGKQKELEDVIKHVELELSRLTEKQPINVA
jgi:hypothetical protein